MLRPPTQSTPKRVLLTPAGWKVEGLATRKLIDPSFRVTAGAPLKSAWLVPVVLLVGVKPKLKYRPTTPTVFDEDVANAEGIGSSLRVPPPMTMLAVPSESVLADWVLKPSRTPPLMVMVPVKLFWLAALMFVSFSVPVFPPCVRLVAVTCPVRTTVPVVMVVARLVALTGAVMKLVSAAVAVLVRLVPIVSDGLVPLGAMV